MILEKMFPRAAVSFDSFPPPPGDDWWYGGAGGASTSGVKINEQSAMAVSSFFAGVRLLSTGVGTIPQKVYRRIDEDNKEPAKKHPLYRIFHRRPNAWQVPSQYYGMIMVHCLLRGNFFARPVLTGPEKVDQILPLHPDKMKVEQLPTGRLRYHYTPPMGDEVTYNQDEIHHVRGLSLDGVTGVSVLTYARNTLGLAAAQEGHGASLFKNGSVPPFFLTSPNKMKPDAIKEFRTNWKGMHGGAENAHNPPVFDNGMEAKALGLTNEDSQWLESRKFQAEEIARFLGIPPHKIAILDKATFSNIEHQAIEYVTDALLPWITLIEQCEVRDFFGDDDEYFPEFLVENRMRGDTLSRYQAYDIGIKGRFLLPNEARARENLNPIEGGDEFAEVPGVTGKGSPEEEDKQEDTEEAEDDAPTPPGLDPKGKSQEAFALLLEDAATRITTREILGIQARSGKADQDKARWCAWVAEFYDRHESYMAKTLAPLALAWFRASGVQLDVEEFVGAWCGVCRGQIQRAESVPDVLTDWRRGHAATLETELKRRFFDAIPANS